MAYSEAISRTDATAQVASVVGMIKSSSARVLVAFLTQSEMHILLEEAKKRNQTGLQWVGKRILDHSGLPCHCGVYRNPHWFSWVHKPNPDPQNSVIREFWKEAFRCSFQRVGKPPCSGAERLQGVHNSSTDVSELRTSNNVCKAAYAVAQALHGMLKCGTDNGAAIESCASYDDFKRDFKRKMQRTIKYIV